MPAVGKVSVNVAEVLEMFVFPLANVEEVDLSQFNTVPVELNKVTEADPP